MKVNVSMHLSAGHVVPDGVTYGETLGVKGAEASIRQRVRGQRGCRDDDLGESLVSSLLRPLE